MKDNIGNSTLVLGEEERGSKNIRVSPNACLYEMLFREKAGYQERSNGGEISMTVEDILTQILKKIKANEKGLDNFEYEYVVRRNNKFQSCSVKELVSISNCKDVDNKLRWGGTALKIDEKIPICLQDLLVEHLTAWPEDLRTKFVIKNGMRYQQAIRSPRPQTTVDYLNNIYPYLWSSIPKFPKPLVIPFAFVREINTYGSPINVLCVDYQNRALGNEAFVRAIPIDRSMLLFRGVLVEQVSL